MAVVCLPQGNASPALVVPPEWRPIPIQRPDCFADWKHGPGSRSSPDGHAAGDGCDRTCMRPAAEAGYRFYLYATSFSNGRRSHGARWSPYAWMSHVLGRQPRAWSGSRMSFVSTRMDPEQVGSRGISRRAVVSHASLLSSGVHRLVRPQQSSWMPPRV